MEKITKLTIKNFMSIEELEFNPGEALTKISGGNAEGKTAILEAFNQIYTGIHNAELIKQGTASAEIGVLFENGKEFIRTIKPNKSTSKLFSENGRPEKTPKAGLKDLIDMVSGNPIALIKMPEKQLIEAITNMIDAPVDAGNINKLIDGTIPDLKAESFTDGITASSHVVEQIMEERKYTKRRKADTTGHIEKLKENISIVAGDAEEIKQTIADNENNIKMAMEKKMDYQDKYVEEFNDAADLIAKQIMELKSELIGIENERNLRVLSMKEKFNDSVAKYRDIIDKAQNQLTLIAGAEKLIESKKESEKELISLEENIEKQTISIAKLRDYKLELCQRIPIEGLVIEDKKLMLNGVHFPLINDAQKIEIGVKLSKYRNPHNRVMLIDGIEAIDPKNQKELFKLSSLNNLQLFVTEVTGNSFKIETED